MDKILTPTTKIAFVSGDYSMSGVSSFEIYSLEIKTLNCVFVILQLYFLWFSKYNIKLLT